MASVCMDDVFYPENVQKIKERCVAHNLIDIECAATAAFRKRNVQHQPLFKRDRVCAAYNHYKKRMAAFKCFKKRLVMTERDRDKRL
jgi:hypothetical protein